jgi:hypothetical protein
MRVAVPFAPLQSPLPPGFEVSEVTLELHVRLGTLENGASCGGRTRADGLRVFFGEQAPAAFRFAAQVPGRVTADVFLVNGPGIPSSLGTSVPATPTRSADSPALAFSKGNPWKDVGSWSGRALGLGHTEVVGVSPLRLWVGLKNSDDVGTSFDLRAILRFAANEETREMEGIARCVSGVLRNPALAQEVRIQFPEFEELYVGGNAPILNIEQLRVSARIGTAANDTFCGGHSSAQGVRLYFGSASRPAGFSFVLEEGHDY